MKEIFLFISLCQSIICFSQEKTDVFFLKTRNAEGNVFLKDTSTNNFLPLFYCFQSDSTPVTGIVILVDKKGDQIRYTEVSNGYPYYNKVTFNSTEVYAFQTLINRDYLSIRKSKSIFKKEKFKLTVYYTEYMANGERQIQIIGKGSKDKGIKFIRTYFDKGKKVVQKEKLNLNDFFKEISPVFYEFSDSIKEKLELTD